MRALQLFIAASIITSASVYAQDDAPAHISSVEGSAVVFHAGGGNLPPDARGVQEEPEPAAINMPIVQGDRVRTMARSRVEVMFPDGGSIAIEPDSEVEFVTTTRVRVIAGGIEHLTAQGVDPRSPSTQNLPPDLQAYGSQFDQNGSWQYEQQYGNVWYPTTVSADWRPYYDGYWSSYPPYGWTWIGYERWAWPTHHYGRWGYAHSRWFWIPGRSYGAAWVSWGTAPGYVSWCPLGYDGRAVVGLSVGFHNSWNAWTVVPRDRFGARGYSARRYAVEPYRIAATTPFIEHRTPPARAHFNAANTPADRRPAAGSVSRGAGTAVPRGDYGAPSASEPRRADAAQPGQQPAERRAGSTRDERSAERRAPGRAPSADQRANPVDHPAYQPVYQPDYQPRYQPRSEPRQEPTNVAPRGDSSYRERRASGDDRARAIERPAPTPAPAAPPAAVQPRREVREAAPARATAPPRGEAPPAQPRGGEQRGNAPAREPHGRGNAARSQEASSGGAAVRRPR